jgi:hypothetical protein
VRNLSRAQASLLGMPRLLLLVGFALIITTATAVAIAASSWPPSTGVFVSIGAHELYPYSPQAKPRVDERYLPVDCKGRLVTHLYDDTPVPRSGRKPCAATWGTLPEGAVERVMQEQTAAIDACWTEAEAPAPSTLKFVVGRDGSVGHATADADDSILSACLVRVAESLTFPLPTDGPVTVTHSVSR